MSELASPTQATALQTAFAGARQRILAVQQADGAIPWFEAGPWDPWNHVECAMALSVMGEREAAEAAYRCLLARQKSDGSWLADYGNALPIADHIHIARRPAPQFHDSNFTAYCALGVLHHALRFQDRGFAEAYWPMVRDAIDFVLSLQSPWGDISWSAEAAADQKGDDALIAGNSSIFKSLSAALSLADLQGQAVTTWRQGHQALGSALSHRPERFNRQSEVRSVFAMDWYYPVLNGVVTSTAARDRLAKDWSSFVDEGRGCHCVTDQPWVTVAETCELSMSMAAAGLKHRAKQLFESQTRYSDADGVYWMGWQYEERIFWPAEQPSWTQAAVILAADVLYGTTPSSDLLIAQPGDMRRKTLRLATASTSSNKPDRSANL
jgi:hypothetical protein